MAVNNPADHVGSPIHEVAVVPEPFVNIEQAAAFLGVKRSWVYEMSRRNRVPSHKVGTFRRFRLSELEAYALGTLCARQEVAPESEQK